MLCYVFIATPLTWIIWSAVALAVNYTSARKFKLPIITIPFSPNNAMWIILQSWFLPLLERFPFGNGTFTRYCRWGFEFPDKAKTYQELGDTWILCTPESNWVYTCDADAVKDLFSRRTDFVRPLRIYRMLRIFGNNIATTEGNEWKRHRKITTTSFNEQKSGLVWKETLKQTNDMLTCWTENDAEGIDYSAKDVRTLSLNVLARIAFGRSYPFHTVKNPTKIDDSSNYRETLAILLDNALLMLVLRPRLLSMSFIPKKWQKIGRAITEFQQFMADLLNEERNLIRQGKPGSGNMISSLLESSKPSRAPKGGDESQWDPDKKGLTESEIFGNIFVFNFAGHDTTANTLAYSVMLLAAHPEVQDWISKEIRSILPEENSETWNYEHTFPRLKRCFAVLLETLRLYSPSLGIPKETGNQAQVLKLKHRLLFVPSQTMVVPGVLALHTHPQYWGSDALTWRPSRWIVPPVNFANLPISQCLAQESIHVPRKGSYIAWSDGPRVCPGKKLAQVEFLAVMSRLFRDHVVLPVPKPAESAENARQRVLNMVEDSKVQLLLQMQHPNRVSVTWLRR